MTQRQGIERSIIAALRDLGPSTARRVEAHEGVVLACRKAKLRCRHQLDIMTAQGLIKSDGAYQGAIYSVGL